MPKFQHRRPTRKATPAPQRAKLAQAALTRSGSLRHPAPGAIVQRAMAAPHSLRPAELIAMQRTLGNRAAGTMLARSPVQAKLIVNAPGDQYEREADRVADAVMRVPAMPREETPGAELSPVVMTKPAPEYGGDGSFAASEDFAHRLQASQGRGRPLPSSLRETFETRFGTDFSGVRVHSETEAGQLSHAIQAQAFTRGSDIFLGAGNYAPGTAAGKRLLAHELTHVAQQGAAPPKRNPADAGEMTIQPSAARGQGGERIQRKLDWQKTDWSKATEARVSKGGGGGALFVKENPEEDPVVVKSGEKAPAEVLLAKNLHSKRKEGKWTIVAPGARIVAPSEGKIIKDTLPKTLKTDDWDDTQKGVATKRAQKIIEDTDQPGTMVYEFARGKEFKDLTTEIDRTKILTIMMLFHDESFVEALGMISAIDIFTGNFDRFVEKFNPENFKIDFEDPKIPVIRLIDNVDDTSQLKLYKFKQPSDEDDLLWVKQKWTNLLKNNEYETLATGIITDTIDNAFLTVKWWRQPDAIFGSIKNALNEDRVKKWLATGLKLGKESLLDELVRQQDVLTEGMAEGDKQDVVMSFTNRLRYIRYPNSPWEPVRTDLQKMGRPPALPQPPKRYGGPRPRPLS
jgi:hypothetical protein